REEVEKFQRYGHVFALLVVDLASAHNGEDPDSLRKRLEWAVASHVRHIDLVALDPPSRMLVLMPLTDRRRAEVASKRVATAIAEADVPMTATLSSVFSYPEDATRVVAIA